MHVYALRQPDYSQKNKKILHDIVEGECVYQCEHYTIYENAIDLWKPEDMGFGLWNPGSVAYKNDRRFSVGKYSLGRYDKDY